MRLEEWQEEESKRDPSSGQNAALCREDNSEKAGSADLLVELLQNLPLCREAQNGAPFAAICDRGKK
jgi:hypothetical protein